MQYNKNRDHMETDVLSSLVKRLATRDAARRQLHAQELFAYVASLGRQLSAERYAKALQSLAPQLFTLLQSTHESDQLGALAAIDLLIDLAQEDQIIRFANYLRNFLAQPHTTRTALLAASAALGHLASANATNASGGVSGTLVAAFVDFEVKRAFEWLQGGATGGSAGSGSGSSSATGSGSSHHHHKQDALFSQRRLAACFVLRELAQSAPTLFHVNLTTFFQSIWGAIRDARVEIREAATDALRACLELIAKRQTRHRVQWYCKVYDQVFEGLNLPTASSSSSSSTTTNSSSNSISISSSQTQRMAAASAPTTASWACVHGSLLVIGELLTNTGGFMLPRFREVCDTVLLYKDAKDKLVARTVCVLLPQLAQFCADAFIRHYLQVALTHLMKKIVSSSTSAERGVAVLALGQLASAIGENILSHLPPIVALVKESLAKNQYPMGGSGSTSSAGAGSSLSSSSSARKPNKLYCVETLTCVAHLSQALREKFEPYLGELLEIMMQGGLSDELLDALAQIVAAVPSVLPSVQEKLLNEISRTLRGVPFASVFGESIHGGLGAAGDGELSLGAGGSAVAAGSGVGAGGSASASPSLPPAKSTGVVQALLSSMKLVTSLSSSSSSAALPSPSSASPSHRRGHRSFDEQALTSSGISSSYSYPQSFATVLRGDNADERDAILLSLRTLSIFDFSGNFCLLPFVRDCVALYLKHSDPRVRQQAVLTCSQLLLPASLTPSSSSSSSYQTQAPSWRHVTKRGPSGRVIDELLSQLLLVGASDLDARVRKSVVDSLDVRFDAYLSQEIHLSALLVLLNDEVAAIRERTMQLLERLAPRNPAFVMPSLRRLLLQLLTELEYANASDVRMKEDATRLLGLLIKGAQHLIDPYIVRVLHVLLPKLVVMGGSGSSRAIGMGIGHGTSASHGTSRHGSYSYHNHTSNASLASAVLVTIGELALVAQHQLARYEKYLFPLILHTLQDHSSMEKRQVALQTMGQLAGSTACVVRPYLAFPKLLEILLSMLQHGAATPWALRREAMKTIGILGALDPYKYKLCLSRASMLEANDGELDKKNKKNKNKTSAQSKTNGVAETVAPDHQNGEDDAASAALARELEALARLVPGLDFTSLDGSNSRMGADVLDEKQQIELQLFTAAPIGTKRATGSSAGVAGGGGGMDGSLHTGGAAGADGSGAAGAGGASSGGGANPRSMVAHAITTTTMGTGALFDFEKLLPQGAAGDTLGFLDASAVSPASEAYFPTVAIAALLKILNEPSLATHHHGVIQAIMFIFKSLHIQCVPFLPYIVPPFLRVLARGEPRLRESLFLQLTTLVGIVQAHMKPFFPAILVLSLQFWGQHLPQIVRLLEKMSQASPLEFRTVYFPQVLPKIVDVLQPHAHPEVFFDMLATSTSSSSSSVASATSHSAGDHAGVVGGAGGGPGAHGGGSLGFMGLSSHDQDSVGFLASSSSASGAGGGSGAGGAGLVAGGAKSSSKNSANRQAMAALQIQVVQALVVFKDAVEGYVYLLVPALLRLMESLDTPLDVKIVAIYALARVCIVAKFDHYAGARMLQPLARVARQISAKSSMFFGSSGGSNNSGGSGAAGPGATHSHVSGGMGSDGSVAGGGAASHGVIEASKAEAKQFADVVLYALAALLYQLQAEFLHFEPLVGQLLSALPAVAGSEPTTVAKQLKLRLAIDKLKTGQRINAAWLLEDVVFTQSASLQAMTRSLSDAGAGGAAGPGAPGSSGVVGGNVRLHVNQQNLRRAWEASQRSTREDWLEWMRRFSIELLRESPSAALRSCCALAQAYNPLARELFNPAFVSCWNELYEQYQDYLVRALETAFQSETIPAEILQTLLNLAEFMEHDVEALPIDIRELGELAQKCHAYAKALHYKELEFHTSPSTCIEALISINNQLGQPEAAVGILKYAQQQQTHTATSSAIHVQETWYEKLQDWQAALRLYDAKIADFEATGATSNPSEWSRGELEVYIGKMRCLEALGEWEELAALAANVYSAIQARKAAAVQQQASAQQAGAAMAAARRAGSSSSLAPGISSSGPASARLARLNSSGSNSSTSALSRQGSFSSGLAPPSSSSLAAGGGGGIVVDESSVVNGELALKKISMLGAKASWCLAQWDTMATYVDVACGSASSSSSGSPGLSSSSSLFRPATTTSSSSTSSSFAETDTESALFRAVLAVHHNQFDTAYACIDETRRRLDVKLGALVGESYSRAYQSMVTLQQLSELEEIVTYKKLRVQVAKTEEAARYKRHLIRMWHARLQTGCKRNVDVWQQILAVRSLIVAPYEDMDTWLQFASLCRQSGNLSMSLKVFTKSLALTPSSLSSAASAAGELMVTNGGTFGYGEREHHRVAFAYLKHLWAVGDKRKALGELQSLVHKVAASSSTMLRQRGAPGAPGGPALGHGLGNVVGAQPQAPQSVMSATARTTGSGSSSGSSAMGGHEEELLVKCHLKLAEWQLAIHDQQLDRVASVPAILASLKMCTEVEPKSYKAWHAWALMNFYVVEHHTHGTTSGPAATGRGGGIGSSSSIAAAPLAATTTHPSMGPYIASAIEGFFKSISLGRSRWASNVQQDILRVLTLWFTYGHRADVHQALVVGFASVSIETWLIVIPQLIARIHTPSQRIHQQLHRLLCAIGEQHPHALIYPLSVALKSPLHVRQQAAEAIMTTMRRHYVELVDEALLVSRELIRVAILWHEMWHEGLEEASRLYFGEHDVEGMVAVLEPLHQMMDNGPETLRELSFQQAFGRDLREAHEWLQRYLHGSGPASGGGGGGGAPGERGGAPRAGKPGAAGTAGPASGSNASHNESDLNRAWDLYYHVFRRINKQLPQLTTLELQYVSPNLLQARHLSLAVPGTYRAGHSIVTIGKFLPTVQVITSKQRPRRVTLVGSNGLEYMFLLKGHEDLRQDERVMQLFGLVNALLINDRTTSKKELKIHRYPVIPLSHNAGIIGWVPHCDTLHQLIRDYRDARKILLNIEHRLMLQMAPDYDALTLLQKVEVFQYALENTAGQDLYKVLWLKSENSEVWLERRTNYTRSLAVMSMVGYILGLGDRHPSNLMLHRFTGTIVHIDFGDCFEVAMHREKYPEKIPFRLTRMLTNAMEVSGIEGNFRSSCESVMSVLRENRHSLMAMLEAFVYDPLIWWRLLAPKNPKDAGAGGGGGTGGATAGGGATGGATGGAAGGATSLSEAVAGGASSITMRRAGVATAGAAATAAAVAVTTTTTTTRPAPAAPAPGAPQLPPAAPVAAAPTTTTTVPTREQPAPRREEPKQEEKQEDESKREANDNSSSSDSDDGDDQVAESLSASAVMVSNMPRRPRPQRAAPQTQTQTQTQPSRGGSRPIAQSLRSSQLPPRPLSSSVAGSRPMSMSKSIAFTRRPPPPPSARTIHEDAADDGDGSGNSEPVERIDHTTTNLAAEISTLAASVTTTGQGSLRRSFSVAAAEAMAAMARATAASTATATATAPVAPQAAVDEAPTAPAPGPPQTQTQPPAQAQQPSVAQSQSKSEIHANRSHRERELVQALGPEGAAAPREALNEKAVAVIRRVQSKLTGRDFDDVVDAEDSLDVGAQVQRLIDQAASHENLCQCYIGWCPFW